MRGEERRRDSRDWPKMMLLLLIVKWKDVKDDDEQEKLTLQW